MPTYERKGNFIHLAYTPDFRLQISPDDTLESLKPFVFVLDCITLLMKHYFPSLGSASLTILYSEDFDCPVCFRPLQMILLNTRPCYWSQIAYQFAHELCHYVIPGDVAQNLRWIEESICQMSSLFFLRAIGILWKTSGVSYATTDGAPYYPSFERYAQNDAQGAEVFQFDDSIMISYLESECEDRPKNKHLANHLLPIFTEHPGTWQAVPFLCQIHEPSLQKAFDAWIQISPPAAHPGLRRIRDLFGFPDSDQSDLPALVAPASN